MMLECSVVLLSSQRLLFLQLLNWFLLCILLLILIYSRDMVLIMTVEPGFGGQKFMEDCLEKVVEVRALSPTVYIEVDGGVSVKNAELCASKGANVLVSGSAIFGAADIEAYIAEMKSCINKHL